MAKLFQITRMMKDLSYMHQIKRSALKWEYLTPCLHNLDLNLSFHSEPSYRSGTNQVTCIRL